MGQTTNGPDHREEFGKTTNQLATYLTTLDFEDIPQEVIERERWHLLDTLGTILYGNTTPWVQKVTQALDSMGETNHGTATIPGTELSIPPARACLVNGTASHAMDYDDYCQDAGVHAGSAVVPAALAHAETTSDPVNGKDVLTAIAAGVEVGIRTGYGIGRGSLYDGWHIAGWTDAFAGAATTGYLQNLTHEQMGHALAIAGTQGAGLMGATYGAEVKRFHMGKAAESGFLASTLAREELTGDTKIFEERWGGIGQTMSDDYDIPAVTNQLGDHYELLDKLTFKPFPSVGQTHPPVSAVKKIVEENKIDTENVTNVHVKATEAAKEKAGRDYEPVGVMAAQASMQYAIATYLVDGEIRIDAYTEEAIRRNSVLERINDIDIVADNSLVDDAGGFNSRYKVVVTLETSSGDSFTEEIDIPKGFPENPMSEEEMLGKFREQATHVIDEKDANAIIDFVMELEEKDNFAGIVKYMQP